MPWPEAAMGTTMVAVAVPRWMLPAPHMLGRSVPAMYQRMLTLRPSCLKYPSWSATANWADICGSRTSQASTSASSGFCARASAAAPSATTAMRTAIRTRMSELLSHCFQKSRGRVRLAPAEQPPLGREQERVDDRSEEPEHEGSHDDLGGQEERAALHDQVAEPGVGAHKLGADDHEQGQREAQPQRHDDAGQRGGHDHAADEIEVAGAEAGRRTQQRHVDAQYGGG